MLVVNTSVANVYRSDSYRSEIITQGLLWEELVLLEKGNDFSLVRLIDGYEGWISNHQIVQAGKTGFESARVSASWIAIKDEPGGRQISDAVMGSELQILNKEGEFYEVLLPDGTIGFSAVKNFESFPNSERENCVELAKKFLGVPYFWGGRSVKGFDCSGFTQSVFGWLGINLPRDAWMQHRDSRPVSDKPEFAEVGDLYFFAEQGEKITHVGIALGNGGIIHARGMVRINSLIAGKKGFDQELKNTFVSVQTFW